VRLHSFGSNKLHGQNKKSFHAIHYRAFRDNQELMDSQNENDVGNLLIPTSSKGAPGVLAAGDLHSLLGNGNRCVSVENSPHIRGFFIPCATHFGDFGRWI
jgi:hypothetical protein